MIGTVQYHMADWQCVEVPVIGLVPSEWTTGWAINARIVMMMKANGGFRHNETMRQTAKALSELLEAGEVERRKEGAYTEWRRIEPVQKTNKLEDLV